MSSFAQVYSVLPHAALTATNESSGGSPSALLILLIVAGGLWLISFVGGRAAATVVVVEKPTSSFLGFGLITLALGILFFAYLGPATGLV